MNGGHVCYKGCAHYENSRNVERIEKRSSAIGRRIVLNQLKTELEFVDRAISSGLITYERALEYLREKVVESLDRTTSELFSM